jgi:hypothetical protein
VTTAREVLEFIARRSRRELLTTCEDVAVEFDLHPLTARDHLKRLWWERLIRALPSRQRGSRYRLQSGERISELRFRLAPRGKDRLEWYEKQDEQEREEDAWF